MSPGFRPARVITFHRTGLLTPATRLEEYVRGQVVSQILFNYQIGSLVPGGKLRKQRVHAPHVRHHSLQRRRERLRPPLRRKVGRRATEERSGAAIRRGCSC